MVGTHDSSPKNSSAELVGNIAFVPVIRQRLNFAVLVRRALYEFACGPTDVVAVELPGSALKYVRRTVSMWRAASKLPNGYAHLIVAYSDNSEYREVLPVVPCDAVIEAVRYADEKDLPLKAIDREVLPAHLWQRHCFRGDDWPDDALVLHSGPRAYVALISDWLATPMARIEPIDSWREEYMADQLRELSVRYRRVFCVCDATHLEPIKTALTIPSHTSYATEVDSRPTSRIQYEIVQPNEHILLSYLDDIPAVTELFEKERQSDAVIDFDKMGAVLKLVADVCHEELQRQLSIHEWRALSKLMRNMARDSGRLTPTMAIACAAARTCIDSLAGELLLQRCMKYGQQFLTKSIDAGKTMLVIISPDREGTKFVSRSCNPLQKTYIPIPPPPDDDPGEGTGETFIWPPYDQLVVSMTATACKRALNTTLSDERVIWHTEKFRGSLADGIDLRATVRGALRPYSPLYVRVRRKQKRQRIVDSLDPVVWILQSDARYGYFIEQSFGIPPLAVTAWYFHSERRTRYHNKAKEEFIETSNCYGFTLFIPFSTSSLRDLRKRFGDSLEWRVPRPQTLPRDEKLAQVLHPAGSRSWYAQLMLTALRYCKHGIVCILPDEITIDEEVSRECIKRGKTLFRVSLREFDGSEVSKLKTIPMVTASFGFPPEIEEAPEGPIVQRFASLMAKYWV
jgi:hypothetical protein